ncbi:MAG: DHH family phosphoesterase, partial [Bacillota bacterium]|nr:DHH family phosphoesterase [Bacillota bacterium]
MQIITSHLNLDFDGLASMVAASKLYSKAKLVLPDKISLPVQRFLALYKDTIPTVSPKQLDWEKVQQVIIVDTAAIERIGSFRQHLQKKEVEYIIYDHHPPGEGDIKGKVEQIQLVGATVTLLVEEIRAKEIAITAFEATIMALGLY